jgi:hypothetical protein
MLSLIVSLLFATSYGLDTEIVHILLPNDNGYTIIDYIVNEQQGYYIGRESVYYDLPLFTKFCIPKVSNGRVRYPRTGYDSRACDIAFTCPDIMFSLKTADYSQNNTLRFLTNGFYASKYYPIPLIIDVRVMVYNLCFHEMAPVIDEIGNTPDVITDFHTALNYCKYNPHCNGIIHTNWNSVYKLVYGIPFRSPYCWTTTVWTNYDIYSTWPAKP